MKTLGLIPILFVISCIQRVKAENGKNNSNGFKDSFNQIDSSKNDSCDMHNQFAILKEALSNKEVEQIATYFDFPIKDQGVLTFANSEQSQQVRILNVENFKQNLDKIFPNEFLSLIRKIRLNDNNEKGKYQEIGWENTYSGSSTFKRCKMQYKSDNDIVVLRFIIENRDETGKYETVIEYFFKFENCKLKFEKSIIAG